MMYYVLATGTPTISDTLTTSFTSIATDISSGIVSMLPIALGVVGSVMVIKFGIRLFKQLVKPN